MRPIRACRRAGPLLCGLPLLATILIAGPSCSPRSGRSNRGTEAVSTNQHAVAEAGNHFAFGLYERLQTGHDGNLFFSPASLSSALAMTYAGARGQTAEEMARVLHFRLPMEKLHPAFGDLRRGWDARDDEQGDRLSEANRLWGQRGLSFSPEFLAVTREHYGAELAQVDFAGQTEQARQRINAWVDERTQGKIRELIAPGVLGAATRLVLTNAIDFKGRWTEPFRKELTRAAPFHISAGQQADVPLMYQQGDFTYWAGDGLKVLELPYTDGDLAMLVLLPDAPDGLSALEARLTAANLSRWRASLRPREVRVFLPRFTSTSRFRLAEVLRSMGMTRLFTPGEADLTGMSREGGLSLSAVIHEAVVDVNEEGTEAVAATGSDVKSAEDLREPATFRADHPFVFLIQDNRSGIILFLGRQVDPRG